MLLCFFKHTCALFIRHISYMPLSTVSCYNRKVIRRCDGNWWDYWVFSVTFRRLNSSILKATSSLDGNHAVDVSQNLCCCNWIEVLVITTRISNFCHWIANTLCLNHRLNMVKQEPQTNGLAERLVYTIYTCTVCNLYMGRQLILLMSFAEWLLFSSIL